MNTPHTFFAFLVALLCSACGGGDGDISPLGAARLLLDQTSECFAVASGRVSPDKFNTAASDIASVPVDEVCRAWPSGLNIDCQSAYAALSRHYTDGGQCAVNPA